MGDEKKQDQVEVRIVFNPSNGAVGIGGAIQDRMFCLGLLEMAKVALGNYHAELEAKRAREAIIRVAAPGIQHQK
jgi:hypothetical protein